MVAPHEMVFQLDHVVLVVVVRPVHQLQEADFDLSLHQERLLVLDDFDGDEALLFEVVCFDHLAEAASAYEGIDFVPI